MSVRVDIQRATETAVVPENNDLRKWARATLTGRRKDAELTVRIVDEAEGAELNQRWRHKPGATNVLSFGCEGVEQFAPDLLGDLVICAPVVNREAAAQRKTAQAHWAHMVVHGTLHLLGFDHNNDTEASVMEHIETEIMGGLGYPDPYAPLQDL